MEQQIYTKDAKTASSSSQPARGHSGHVILIPNQNYSKAFCQPDVLTYHQDDECFWVGVLVNPSIHEFLFSVCPSMGPMFPGSETIANFTYLGFTWFAFTYLQLGIREKTQCWRYLSAAGNQILYNVDPIKVQNCESSRTELFLFAKSKKGTTKTYHRYYIIIVYHIIWHHVIIELYVLYVLYT